MAHAHSTNALALVTARKEWHMLLLSRQLLVWRHYEWTLNAEQHVKHLLLLLVAVVLLLRKRGLEFVAKDQLWVLLRRGLRDGCASILRFRYIPFLNGELENERAYVGSWNRSRTCHEGSEYRNKQQRRE